MIINPLFLSLFSPLLFSVSIRESIDPSLKLNSDSQIHIHFSVIQYYPLLFSIYIFHVFIVNLITDLITYDASLMIFYCLRITFA